LIRILTYNRYILKSDSSKFKNKKKTTKSTADRQDKRTILLRHISNWRQSQIVYTPYAATMIAGNPALEEGHVHLQDVTTIPLYLPSTFPAHIRDETHMKSICGKEKRLREAQANDALNEIRRHRRVIQGLWQFKKINVSGTGNRPNTRMLTLFNQIQEKVNRAADRYRRARNTLLILDPEGSWRTQLKELKNEDIRGPGKEADDRSSNKRFEPSWIWLVSRSVTNEQDEVEFNESMRVEWAKSRARMMRWGEEYQLIQEEMRRVVTYFEFKALEWEEWAKLRMQGNPSILNGVSAYAHKQAYILREMAERCAEDWLPELKKCGVIPSWAVRYPAAASTTRKRRQRRSDGEEEPRLESHTQDQLDDMEELSDDEDSDEDEDEEDYDLELD